MSISPFAGKSAEASMLVDVPKLVTAYYSEIPDPTIAAQRVVFGTSGHRGSSFTSSFNEQHILAITQAICEYRAIHKIDGPLFLGKDTHALSEPALRTALEVLAANDVETVLSEGTEYTPTPVISHAILTHNRASKGGRADGIVITPSHNPPQYGGFKYNPPSGGPAAIEITDWIEHRANELIEGTLAGVRRTPYETALHSRHVHRHDYLTAYVEDLCSVVDLDAIRSAGLSIGVDPLGGAGIDYWPRIAERYKLSLHVVNQVVDPTFRFMYVDGDGQIRMDPSSPYAMRGLIALKDQFDVSFACDTDHDRHGIVTKSVGLMLPNHFLAVCVQYLANHRPDWRRALGVGKTIVSSSMMDRVVAASGDNLYEVPVGFKWFSGGLLNGSLCFAGEESAGATFLRRDGTVWTTDKDGIVPGLLAAEIIASTGRDPGELYQDLCDNFGDYFYERMDVACSAKDKEMLANISGDELHIPALAGDPVKSVLTTAPANGSPIGGIKVMAEHGWFAARPSGTEAVYKIYAESFRSPAHLEQIQEDARELVSHVLTPEAKPGLG